MRQIISLLLENEPGSLSKVIDLFSARGLNIESLTVSSTNNSNFSHITITFLGSREIATGITKHFHRLINVIKWVNLINNFYITKEMMLVKIYAHDIQEFKRIIYITNNFNGCIVNITDRMHIIELTGNRLKLNAFIQAIGRKIIMETAYTGVLGMSCGKNILIS